MLAGLMGRNGIIIEKTLASLLAATYHIGSLDQLENKGSIGKKTEQHQLFRK